MRHIPRWSDRSGLLAAGVAILLVTVSLRSWLHLTNPTMAALSYLLVVLLTATVARLRAQTRGRSRRERRDAGAGVRR